MVRKNTQEDPFKERSSRTLPKPFRRKSFSIPTVVGWENDLLQRGFEGGQGELFEGKFPLGNLIIHSSLNSDSYLSGGEGFSFVIF
jgi:hypothetical protein